LFITGEIKAYPMGVLDHMIFKTAVIVPI